MGLLKPACASVRAAESCAESRALLSTIFMPRPPPPAEALMMIGKPMRSTASSASLIGLDDARARAGSARPPSSIASRAETLSPMRRMISGCGPIQLRPHCFTTSAKSAFSARKP